MIIRIAGWSLLGLVATWCLVVLPDLFRASESPVDFLLSLVLGAFWMALVPGAFYLLLRYMSRGGENLRALARYVGFFGAVAAFVVSYAVLAFYTVLGCFEVIRHGGVYEANLMWVFAPLAAGKYGLYGGLAGLCFGGLSLAHRYARA